MSVEHTIGIWKLRWSSLRGLQTQIKRKEDFASVNKWIAATAILHNIVLKQNDTWEYNEEQNEADNSENEENEEVNFDATKWRESVMQKALEWCNGAH